MTQYRGTQKHEREAVRLVERMHDGAIARIETRQGINAHKWLVLDIAGHTLRFTLPSSPRDGDHSLHHLRRQVRRDLRARGITV